MTLTFEAWVLVTRVPTGARVSHTYPSTSLLLSGDGQRGKIT
jgi:hypothetical protein